MILLLAALVTFAEVQPILERHCQSCHRKGEVGPMPLSTFKEARPWAKAIRQAVTARTMPPWFADPRFGKFKNDPRLSDEEIATIGKWVDGGSVEGHPVSTQAKWLEGWGITPPNKIVEMKEAFQVPAKGDVLYQHIVLENICSADCWVTAAELRPSVRGVVHHAVVYIREPGSKWLAEAKPGVAFGTKTETVRDILLVYTPGQPPFIAPDGMGKKIPAGSSLVLQVHYTTNGKAVADKTKIGLVFAKEAPKQRILTLQMNNGNISIPPGDRSYHLSVSGSFPNEAILLNLFPHMHLRGSSFVYAIAERPGQWETLLSVKPYRFNWQLRYDLDKPRLLPKGTRILMTATYDNSANNPYNPDPDAEVHWGEQSWEEMMVGFFDVVVPASMDKESFFIRQ